MIRILLSTRLGERRLSQADLARKTGIRANTINELYHEYAVRVSLKQLDLICEALGCELDELIVRVPDETSKLHHTRRGDVIPSQSTNKDAATSTEKGEG